jgi:sn-glycerol 3-phosphate transport system substrate-binding protein
MIRTTRRAVLGTATLLALPNTVRAAGGTEISFYFPVAVGGPITKIIDPGSAGDRDAAAAPK